LVDRSEQSVEEESEIIKDACGRQPVFLSGREGGKIVGGFNRPVVGHDLEDATVGSGFLLELALADLGVVGGAAILARGALRAGDALCFGAGASGLSWAKLFVAADPIVKNNNRGRLFQSMVGGR
jgi:hypothetical protein